MLLHRLPYQFRSDRNRKTEVLGITPRLVLVHIFPGHIA